MKRQFLNSLLILLFVAGLASADVYYVPDHYPTIQRAIDNVGDGNEVVVRDGIWSGSGNFNLDFNGVNAITVRSENGPANCIIDCKSWGRAFFFFNGEGSDLVIKGFTIKNGLANGGAASETHVNGAGDPVTFYRDGGAIYCTAGSSPTISNCIIQESSAFWYGGGLACMDGAQPELINCLFTNNYAGDMGGAIYCGDSGPSFELCTITNNGAGINYLNPDAGLYGPRSGIACDGTDPDIKNSIIWEPLFWDAVANLWRDGDDLYGATATYSCIEDGIGGEATNTALDPLFREGAHGIYYLAQTQAGNPADSPCIDTGDGTIRGYDGYLLGQVTTSTSPVFQPDWAVVDMGFHYPAYDGVTPLPTYWLWITVIGNGTISATPGAVNPGGGFLLPLPTLGTNVSLTAAPATGYRVKSWTGTDDDPNTTNNNSAFMDTNKTVTVEFELDLPKILYVGADGQYSTIQHAIDAAHEGDTIQIAPANEPYMTSEGFYINKNLIITSANPDDPCCVASTIIEKAPTWGGTAFTFDNVNQNTVLSGLTIRKFSGTAIDGRDSKMPERPNGEPGGSIFGGAIQCFDASPIIQNCVIYDCNVIGGDGGQGAGGTAEHPDGYDGGWPGYAYGGAIAVWSGSSPTIINTTFDNCIVFGGNGGDGGDGKGDPQNGHGGRAGGWTYNENSYWYLVGGGFWEYGYSAEVGCWNGYYDNYTKYSGLGGAIYVGLNASIDIRDSSFINCQTIGGQTGIGGQNKPSNAIDEPSLRWRIDNFGGAIHFAGNNTGTIENCMFINNTANSDTAPEGSTDSFVGYGGAIDFEDNANIIIKNCTFMGNDSSIGGAIHGTWSDPNIVDCNFIDNSAYHGGGALFVGGTVDIQRSNFSGNQAYLAAAQGGGICSLGANAVIQDCNVSNNSATGSGGGIYISSKDIFEETIAAEGAMVIKNCLITQNVSGRDGGGISANWSSEPNIINCTIANNTVTGIGFANNYGGGLYASYDSDVKVIDTIIWGNIAAIGPQIGVTSGDPIAPQPSAVEIAYSDIGPRYTNILLSSAEGGSQQSSSPMLVDGQAIYDQFDAGQDTVRVIVSLLEPVEMREETDWQSPESVGALRAEIASRQSSALCGLTSAEFTLRHQYKNQAGFSGEVTIEGLNELLNNSSVAYIEPVRYMEPMLAQAIPLANALDVRDTYSGQGIAVAIVDTGVDYTHPRLGGGGFPNAKVIGGYDFGNGDADPRPPTFGFLAAHGTACAGIVAGDLGTVGDYIGGVANSAKIYALKATTDDDPLQLLGSDDTLAAWNWCITHRDDDPDNPIKIISNSWGGDIPFADPAVADAVSPAHTAAAETAVALGITILASSGNDGFAGDGISWPAAMSNVISVGAVYDTTDAVTEYSNTADNLDILAPADPMYTTDIVGAGGSDPGDYTPDFGGTSSACPFAAGSVASLQSAAFAETGSYLTSEQVRFLLTVSGDPVTDAKVAITKPRVNLGAAVSYLTDNFITAVGPIYVEEGSTLIGFDANGDTWDPSINSNNISDDPLFKIGLLGSYYLSQISAGQLINSNCVDAGSNLALALGFSSEYTTRTDEKTDEDIIDMGYHYPLSYKLESCSVCDLFGDGNIDFGDIAELSSYWLSEDCSPGNQWCEGADLNFDTEVSFGDFAILSNCWRVEDTTAPASDPAEWEVQPYSTSDTSISMTAKTVVDGWGDIVYFFECVSGGCSDSGWTYDRTYIDTGLATDDEYGYRVRASDFSYDNLTDPGNPFDVDDPNDTDIGNKTGWSETKYVIAGGPVPDTTAPTPNPMQWATGGEPGSDSPTSIIMTAATATDDSGGAVEYYFQCVSGGGNDSGWITGTTYADGGLTTGVEYGYRVKARDDSFNETAVSSTGLATPRQAFNISSALQLTLTIGGGKFNWYHRITVDALPDDGSGMPLYYRFVDVSFGTFSSAWSIDPVAAGSAITYDALVKLNSYTGQECTWRVDISHNADGSDSTSSTTVTILENQNDGTYP
ncbi:MAG: S8 family serine peptidase [Planctomycetes bacterium]|nr:S8 family serine peptidase [Planctomycetota bacterium]